MRITVVNVAADSGGALSVLNDFHAAVELDAANEWTFLLSTPALRSTSNITLMRFPWIKKSLSHRLWFDYVTAPRVIRALNPDVVLSLQNVVVPRLGNKQVVYLHQSLPFSRFTFDPRSSLRMWFYQKAISQRIRRNLHKADRVIVQATWMKEAVLKDSSLPSSKIAVVRPSATHSDADPYEASPQNRRRFFYPASDLEYKNHAVIHSAVDMLNRAGIENFEVVLTISERNAIRRGANTSGCIRYVGRMDLAAVQQQYASAVLIFPSIVETVGLPLLEARQARTFIIASDLAYAREALGDYRNAFYFQPTAADQLAELMAAIMTGEIPHYPDSSRVDDRNDSWTQLIEIVLGAAS